MSKVHAYESDEIEVRYDLKRCIHAAECVKGLPRVFDPNARPWIQPEQASADEVAAVIEQCPTGALTYHRKDGSAGEPKPTDNIVRVVENGPLYIHGALRVEDPGGRCAETETRVALCRCGVSKNKPFCDNSHVEAGFRSG